MSGWQGEQTSDKQCGECLRFHDGAPEDWGGVSEYGANLTDRQLIKK
jgi:hypothetical protein